MMPARTLDRRRFLTATLTAFIASNLGGIAAAHGSSRSETASRGGAIGSAASAPFGEQVSEGAWKSKPSWYRHGRARLNGPGFQLWQPAATQSCCTAGAFHFVLES